MRACEHTRELYLLNVHARNTFRRHLNGLLCYNNNYERSQPRGNSQHCIAIPLPTYLEEFLSIPPFLYLQSPSPSRQYVRGVILVLTPGVFLY